MKQRQERRQHARVHGARRPVHGHAAGRARSRRRALSVSGARPLARRRSRRSSTRSRACSASPASATTCAICSRSSEPAARLAVDYFVYRAAKEIGALAAVLRRHRRRWCSPPASARTRRRSAGGSARPRPGSASSSTATPTRRSGPRISRAGSRVSAWVIPTNEELMIARHTGALLGLAEPARAQRPDACKRDAEELTWRAGGGSRSTATRRPRRSRTARARRSPSTRSRRAARWRRSATSGRARGKPNLWGAVPEMAEMQSEAGAAGAVHGALQAGALVDDVHGVAGPAPDDPEHVQDRRRADAVHDARRGADAGHARAVDLRRSLRRDGLPADRLRAAVLELGAGGARHGGGRARRDARERAFRSCTSSTASAPRTRSRRSRS